MLELTRRLGPAEVRMGGARIVSLAWVCWLMGACSGEASLTVECVIPEDCPGGEVCYSGRCLAPCTDEAECGLSQTCRFGVCLPEGLQPASRRSGDSDSGRGDAGLDPGGDETSPLGGDEVAGGDDACCAGPVSLGEDLTPNTDDEIPRDVLQVVTHYQGANTSPSVTIELERVDDPGETTTFVVGGLAQGEVATREIALGSWRPTGTVTIRNTYPYSSIWGVAVAMFWKDTNGSHLLRSHLPSAQLGLDYLGAYPLDFTESQWAARIPQVTSAAGKRHARAIAFGAELMSDGTYYLRDSPLPGAPDLGTPANSTVGPQPRTADLNEGGALATDSVQIVVFYAGDASGTRPTLTWSCTVATAGVRYAVEVPSLPASDPGGGGVIYTLEYDMRGCVPNGLIEISGVAPDGDPDGVAVGMLWKTSSGSYRIARSVGSTATTRFVGMWPLDMTDDAIETQLSLVSNGMARDTARVSLLGAACLGDGTHALATH